MEIFKGSAIFPGIAIGKILFYSRGEYQIRQYLSGNVKKELSDFQEARLQVKEQLYKLSETEGGDYKKQAGILEEPSFCRAIESVIENQKVAAAYAVSITRDELLSTFGKLEDPFIRERIGHVGDVCARLLVALGETSPRICLGEDPVILVAETLSPTEVQEMEKEKLLAVVTHQGSEVSHTAIMAKTMEIPVMVDVEVKEVWDGRTAVVDGYTGTIYLNPDPDLLKEYGSRQKEDMQEREELLKLKDEKTVTADGKEIALYANIGNLDDLNSVLYYGALGIGLFRSEFQYLGREEYPRENELFLAYKQVAETMDGRIAVIRTVDLGADKQADYMEMPSENNPLMGNRGIRLCLDRRRMFKAQLRAIYRASVYGNLALMYPMITSLEELDEIEQVICEVKKSLRKKEIPYRDIPTGIMIETPAAVMISEELAKRADFLSLGTNDLTQYTLAMDRQNPLLKGKYQSHHPAVLRMIRMAVEAGHKEGCEVSICGELASDTSLTELFLRMGVDSLSVVPACILPLRRAIKKVDLRSQ